MPPIQMTREEYQMKYGMAPVLPSMSKLDTTPAPRRMTTEEYLAEYGQPEQPGVFGGLKNALGGLKQTYGGGEYGLGQSLGRNVQESAKDIQKGNVVKGVAKAAFRTAGDVAGAVYAPVGAALQAIPGFQKAQDYVVEKGYNQKGGLIDTIGDIPAVQKFAMRHPNAGEDVNRLLNLTLAKSERGAKIEPKTMVSRTAEQYKGYKAERQAAKDTKITQKVTEEIANIESNYSKLRKANEYSKDADASRQRIAEADVLPGAVDETGTINTKDAIEMYRKKTIDGKESVVRDNLVRLGEKVNAAQVERALVLEVNRSGLEGADLVAALNGIKKEIQGLKMRGDEFSDIPLEKVHDAKINTTKNIDFNTPPETKTYRKAVARAYKNVVEQNSSYNVKEVNAELSKYYEDITRLEGLNGRKVKGGKLGKYTAQIAGNIIGGAAGGAVGGGFTGAAVGAYVGGETASFLKGKTMAGTFGDPRGIEMPKNAILEKAAADAKLPPKVDLSKPSPKVGAPKGIVKTKEVMKLENEIKRNVEAQKKAISKGDFTLVEKLKEIYDHLVEQLKTVIKKIKDTPNKEGGFAKNPFARNEESGKQRQGQSQVKSPSLNSTTSSKPYQGEKDLTTKILKDLEGKTTVSKQYILDATNRGELKQVERDLIRDILERETGAKIPKGLESLAEESRKYKSAEDFIKKLQDDPGVVTGKMSNDERLVLRDWFNEETSKYVKQEVEKIGGAISKTGLGKETAKQNAKRVVLTDFYNKAAKSDTINVSEFAKKVKAELLPLKVKGSDLVNARAKNHYASNYMREEGSFSTKYDNVALPNELRGKVANYKENIYESPIKTSAGQTHFAYTSDNYFGHTRIEDMADNQTRRVIEVQSDLYQKGRLGEMMPGSKTIKETEKRIKEFNKLQQYNDPTAHFRMIREEIKKAAQDGKTKLQFPTGETAMKIEGLGQGNQWTARLEKYDNGMYKSEKLADTHLKAGQEIYAPDQGSWIITDVLGDGKFKAIPKERMESRAFQLNKKNDTEFAKWMSDSDMNETFDISGKVDTNNPIYKFYEKDLGRYLTNKFGAKTVVDTNGVKWYEVPVKKEWAKMPVEAFALLAGIGLTQQNESK